MAGRGLRRRGGGGNFPLGHGGRGENFLLSPCARRLEAPASLGRAQGAPRAAEPRGARLAEPSPPTCHVVRAARRRAGVCACPRIRVCVCALPKSPSVRVPPIRVCERVPQIHVRFFRAAALRQPELPGGAQPHGACFCPDFPFGSLGYPIPGLMRRAGHGGKN